MDRLLDPRDPIAWANDRLKQVGLKIQILYVCFGRKEILAIDHDGKVVDRFPCEEKKLVLPACMVIVARLEQDLL